MSSIFVYVIMSREGYRYTGLTENLDRRVKEHNDHSLSFWTKRGTGWKSIYHEEYKSRSAARKREQWLESGVGREYLDSVMKRR